MEKVDDEGVESLSDRDVWISLSQPESSDSSVVQQAIKHMHIKIL